jgi:predicted acylesterase/phospholipase RssA
VKRFSGGGLPEGAAELGYEQTLEALLGLVGRPVLVLFSGASGSPFIAGVVAGRLDRGELDARLQEVLLRGDDTKVETLFFHVGTRQSGFVLRPDEFERGFYAGAGELVVHLGSCAVTVLPRGELGRALER